MVQTLPSNRADQPLGVWILPWTLGAVRISWMPSDSIRSRTTGTFSSVFLAIQACGITEVFDADTAHQFPVPRARRRACAAIRAWQLSRQRLFSAW